MSSQKKSIRTGATRTRYIEHEHSEHPQIEDVEPDYNEDNCLSVDEALSTSAFEYRKSEKAVSTFNDWEETKSVSSCSSLYSEYSIQNSRKEALQKEELLDMKVETMAQMSRKSASRDIQGNIIHTLNGMVVPKNEPTPAYEEEDEQSDLEVDFDMIESNYPKETLYLMNKKKQYAVYNKPAQQKLTKKFNSPIKKQRDRQIKGRSVLFKEDDKENFTRDINIQDIKRGLQTGKLTYDDLQFSQEVLNQISFSGKKKQRRLSRSRSRSKNRNITKTKSGSRPRIGLRNSQVRSRSRNNTNSMARMRKIR